ncbi:MAG TPA: hypothetical protein DCR46_03920, partial [Cytophagales bacterium]|nr:hypothetical protein [Cytophagales bacterium]
MKQPLIFDWKISTKCDYVKVDVTETSSGCCVKPGSDFSLSSSKLIANPTDYPVTLSASGTSLNSSLFYQWLDGNGTIVASGVGKNTYSTSTDGTYTLRVAQNSSFISNNSCISEKAVIQQKRELFAPKDTTICLGESLTMMASGGLGNFTWSSSDPIAQAALSSKNSMVTTISGLPEGTYKFVVKADVALFNAVTDGTFASFDTRINDAPPGTYSQTFSTKYKPKPKPDTWANGQYRVESTKITAW